METVLLAIGLSILIELTTIYLRLVVHQQSEPLQKKLHMPRIHHSYPGFAVILLDYVYLQNELLFSVGFALVLSDVFHHLIFEPFVKKHHFDIGMKHHREARAVAARFPAAIALIVVGLFASATPLAPGSWLGVVGIGMLVGHSPTRMARSVKKLLPKRKKK
jgi:hypothetical protein